MPEAPHQKPHPHPRESSYTRDGQPHRSAVANAPPYAELEVTSNFTFLTGASHPDELVQQAALLGHRAIAITDRRTLAGIVRAHVAAKDAGVQLIVGTRLVLNDAPGMSVLVYPTDLASYGRLCALLTLGKRRAPKGECYLSVHDLIEHNQGLLAVVVPPGLADEHSVELIQGLRAAFDRDRVSLAVSYSYRHDDDDRIERISARSD